MELVSAQFIMLRPGQIFFFIVENPCGVVKAGTEISIKSYC
jgi:hypothetical protein